MDVNLRVQQLLGVLQRADTTVQMAIEAELVEMGQAAVAPLADATVGSDSKAAYKAIRVLARMAAEAPDACLVEPLCTCLHSPHSMVRQIAAQVLGTLGDVRAVAPLVETLKDEKLLVQLWAVESLGKLGDPGAVGPLVEVLHSTESSTVRHTIIRTLGGLGDPEVIPLILVYANDENHHVRARVRDAVQQLGKDRPKS